MLRRRFKSDYQILLSTNIIKEYKNTLLDYQEKFKLTKEEIQNRMEMLEYFGTFVTVKTDIDEIKEDPTDNMFLELAVNGGANYIVSKDLTY